jgi:hypothetical protein
VLDSAREKRRIIIIHESGQILKFVHSHRHEIIRNVERITTPSTDAQEVYEANAGIADFVMVLERRAVERFFGAIQDTWSADEDLDEYVHRMYAMVDQYSDGIVTWPGAARTRLGLQWRLGSTYEEIKLAVDQFVPRNSTVVFGVFDGAALWASLILSFDEDRRIVVVTTADPGDLQLKSNPEDVATQLVKWANARFSPCALGLFVDKDGAQLLLSRLDKLAAMQELMERGRLSVNPIPPPLLGALEGR